MARSKSTDAPAPDPEIEADATETSPEPSEVEEDEDDFDDDFDDDLDEMAFLEQRVNEVALAVLLQLVSPKKQAPNLGPQQAQFARAQAQLLVTQAYTIAEVFVGVQATRMAAAMGELDGEQEQE